MTQYESLDRLMSNANAWNADKTHKPLTVFVRRFEPDAKTGVTEYAVSAGNMGWRGAVSHDDVGKFEKWLKAVEAIETRGVVTAAELFA